MTTFTPFLLCSRTITAPLSDVVVTEGISPANVAQAFWDQLSGINGLTVDAAFTYGTGGTTAVLMVDSAFGAGGVWRPIMRFDFATTSLGKTLTSSRASRLSALTFAALSADTAIDYIGDRFRARLTTTGTYTGSGTLLNVLAHPHQ